MSLDAPQQREKLVASLKDQIKKLQKDRDKIKTWYAPIHGVQVRLMHLLDEQHSMVNM
jgi:CCR4-NOT transcriptional regulation complex NOT5 subunit